MGKMLVSAALALILGLVVGGIGPRAELGRVKRELEQARAEAARGGVGSALPLALGVGSLVAAQQRARADGERSPPRFVRSGEALPVPADSPRPLEAGDPPGRGAGAAGNGARGATAALAAARGAAELRAAQYRAAFLEQARLSPEKEAAFKGLVAGMNRELGQVADRLASSLAGKRKLAPRDVADIGAEVLEVYRRSDDRFKAGLDQGGRAALERTDFDLLTQVDLGAFERLVEQAGAMEGLGEPARGTP